jgi:hypothetical protein
MNNAVRSLIEPPGLALSCLVKNLYFFTGIKPANCHQWRVANTFNNAFIKFLHKLKPAK